MKGHWGGGEHLQAMKKLGCFQLPGMVFISLYHWAVKMIITQMSFFGHGQFVQKFFGCENQQLHHLSRRQCSGHRPGEDAKCGSHRQVWLAVLPNSLKTRWRLFCGSEKKKSWSAAQMDIPAAHIRRIVSCDIFATNPLWNHV